MYWNFNFFIKVLLLQWDSIIYVKYQLFCEAELSYRSQRMWFIIIFLKHHNLGLGIWGQ